MAVVNRQPTQFAIEALGVEPSDTVLELGFGAGQGIKTVAALAPRGLVLGIDHSPEMVALASEANRQAIRQGRAALRMGSLDALPWPAESVDKILAVNVVYFFNRTAKELAEARRVLRAGGRIAVYATDRVSMGNWGVSRANTHSLFDSDELRRLFVRGGFAAAETVIRDLTLPFGIKGLLAPCRSHQASAGVKSWTVSARPAGPDREGDFLCRPTVPGGVPLPVRESGSLTDTLRSLSPTFGGITFP
jgi:SAM-dependent methyltransferase